jgi:hypothetical protein
MLPLRRAVVEGGRGDVPVGGGGEVRLRSFLNKEVVMKSGVRWLRRSAFGLGIAVALAFGGYQAFAGPTAMAPCDENPPDMGTCYNQFDCQKKCDDHYGPGTMGFCWYYPPLEEYCCICIL